MDWDSNRPPFWTRRNHETARLICSDRTGQRSLVFLVMQDNGAERLHSVYSNGRETYDEEGPGDIVNAPEIVEGQVNLYEADDGQRWFAGIVKEGTGRRTTGAVRRLAKAYIKMTVGEGVDSVDEVEAGMPIDAGDDEWTNDGEPPMTGSAPE